MELLISSVSLATFCAIFSKNVRDLEWFDGDADVATAADANCCCHPNDAFTDLPKLDVAVSPLQSEVLFLIKNVGALE